jgi:coproporphyrinogen III oxidase-like Fe-S oxidoreductase
MKHWSPLASRRISTIFLGGGTPVLEGPQLGQLFETIHKYFQVTPLPNTSEANPGTVDRASLPH